MVLTVLTEEGGRTLTDVGFPVLFRPPLSPSPSLLSPFLPGPSFSPSLNPTDRNSIGSFLPETMVDRLSECVQKIVKLLMVV